MRITNIKQTYYLAYKGSIEDSRNAIRTIQKNLSKQKIDNKIFYIDSDTLALGIDVTYKDKALDLLQAMSLTKGKNGSIPNIN